MNVQENGVLASSKYIHLLLFCHLTDLVVISSIVGTVNSYSTVYSADKTFSFFCVFLY